MCYTPIPRLLSKGVYVRVSSRAERNKSNPIHLGRAPSGPTSLSYRGGRFTRMELLMLLFINQGRGTQNKNSRYGDRDNNIYGSSDNNNCICRDPVASLSLSPSPSLSLSPFSRAEAYLLLSDVCACAIVLDYVIQSFCRPVLKIVPLMPPPPPAESAAAPKKKRFSDTSIVQSSAVEKSTLFVLSLTLSANCRR